MIVRIFTAVCLITFGGIAKAQNNLDPLFKWPTFTFKVTTSANLNFGFTNSNPVKILRTPATVAPELGVFPGIRINERASVYAGFSLNIISARMAYHFSGYNVYAPDGKSYWKRGANFVIPIYSIPLSFEYFFPIKKSKHGVLTETGFAVNFNSEGSFLYQVSDIHSGQEVFNFSLHDNNNIEWHPSGFVRLGYMKAFKKQGAFSASLRCSFSGTILARGSYKFSGFLNDFEGDVKLPVNALCFDFTYHFRHTRKR